MAKRTYQELLKENLNEFDTTKTVDVKGPMLDPILGYEGDGELPTYKDAASVLERYYFGEERKESEVDELSEEEKPLDKKFENDKGDSSGESMKDTEGPEGEEQAGTSKANTPTASAKENEKDITKEGDESSDGEAVSEKEMNTPDLKSAEMKDADGPEGEEQAGTGDTYKEFKKRVVESIEAISEGVELTEDDDKCEKCGKPDCKCGDKDDDKDKDEDEGDEKEEMEESKGPQAVPAMSKKSTNEDSGNEYEDDKDASGDKAGMKENDKLEVSAEDEDITEALENEIIEKLISEMEDEGEAEGDAPPEAEAAGDEGGDKEEDEGLDVDKKMEEMVNRLTSEGEETMKHVEGPEGEEQAGTGKDAKVVPPRKDRSNEGDKSKGVKPMDKGELADA